MDSSLVSIIVPNYNHYKYLQERLDSIFNQSFQDYEVILLDDASTDDSLRILNSYKDHPKVSHFIVNKINSGSPFKQWMKGIALATGEFIWIAESDDYASPYFLEKILEVFNSQLNVHIVFSGITNVDENNENIGNKTRIERKYSTLLDNDFNMNGKEFLKLLLPDYCVIRNVSCAVFKKSVLSSKSKKITKFRAIGDFYFWIILSLEGYTFSYISEKLNFMRSHNQSVRSNKKMKNFKKKEYRKIHREVFGRRFYDLKVNKILWIYWIRKFLK